MNNREVVAAVAMKTQLSKKTVEAVLKGFIETVGDTLAAGAEVHWVGFGTFHVKHTTARQGRNPSSGEPLYIPAKNVPAFKAGKLLKDRLG